MLSVPVAVVAGGVSAEREVSLRSGREVAKALGGEGFRVHPLVVRRDGGAVFREEALRRADLEALAQGASFEDVSGAERCDLLDAMGALRRLRAVAFIALHGPGGEDGTIQGCLETLGIPHTGSGVLASAIGMDKVRFREFAQANGIPVAPGLVLDRGPARLAAREIRRELGLPCMVKEPASGSSIGVWKCDVPGEVERALEAAWKASPVALAERFVPGRELSVPVWEPTSRRIEALPVIEIRPAKGRPFFDLKAKYDPGGAEEIVPAPIRPDAHRAAAALAIQVHALLGCRGISRTDMILSRRSLVVLEVNTIPGLTEGSLLPKAARAAGRTLGDVCAAMVRAAIERAR